MSAIPSIKEVSVHVRRVFADGTEATFNAVAISLADALTAAQFLAGHDVPANAAAQAVIAKAAEKPQTNVNATEVQNQVKEKNSASVSATTKPSGEQSASTAASSSDAQTSDAPALDYEKDIKPRVLLLSKEKGRDATVATLGRFGVVKATELDPAQWPAFLEFVNKVIAGEANPEESFA